MVVYHARTATVPLSEFGPPEAVYEAVQRHVMPRLDASDPLAALYAKCTHLEPSRRPTMEEVAEELLEIARAHADEVDVAALEEYDRRIERPEREIVDASPEALRRVAQMGSRVAHAAYGEMKMAGISVEKDEEEGMHYLRCASQRGFQTDSATVDLARMMEDGEIDESREIGVVNTFSGPAMT
jgi:TPR repeat protein